MVLPKHLRQEFTVLRELERQIEELQEKLDDLRRVDRPKPREFDVADITKYTEEMMDDIEAGRFIHTNWYYWLFG